MRKMDIIRAGAAALVLFTAGLACPGATPAPPGLPAPSRETLGDRGVGPMFPGRVSEGVHADPGTAPTDGFPWSAQACQQEFSGGPYFNSPGTGPGGADESILQNASLGMSTIGYNCSAAALSWIADDFVVAPPGLDVDQVYFYAYQTGSTTTSTITGARYQIWDGPPNSASSKVVFGDLTTDRMVGTSWSEAYRRTESTPGATTRPIMVQVCSAGFHLPAGTYWIQYGMTGSLSSGPWQPPVALWGTAVTGNAMQYYMGFWTAISDGGPSAPAQGVPFLLSRCCPSIAVQPKGPLAPGMTGVPYPPVSFAAATADPLHLYDTFTWSVSTGSLPDGLTLDSATGVLSGIPAVDGIFHFTVRAAVDGFDGCLGENSYTIAIGCTEISVIANPSSTSGTVGVPIPPVTFTASGGTAPLTFAIVSGAVPDGVELSPDGVLSGTPTAGGTFNFTVEATDANGCKGYAQYTALIAAFDLSFYDDAGRSKLCVNSNTGTFVYTILWGSGAGSYGGKGSVSVANGQLTLVTPPGLPYALSLKFLQRYARATASYSHRILRISSTLVDNNTKDDPPGC